MMVQFRSVLLLSLFFTATSMVLAVEPTPAKKKLLLVTHSGGFIHPSVGTAEDVLNEVAPKYGYDLTCYRFTGNPAAKVTIKGKNGQPDRQTTALEDYSEKYRARTGKAVEAEHCGRLNAKTLQQFDAVLFFTTGNPLNKDEVKDFTEWVKAGGAFAGTHCATDTLFGDSIYGDLIGAYFRGHPPGIKKIKVHVEDPKHPAAAGFSNNMPYEDEIYVFRDEPFSREKLRIIFSCAPGSFDPTEKLTRKDGDYAISWCKEEGQGKVFYTSFGHKPEVWKDERFQKHLFGGIDWTVGRVQADATPSQKKK